MNATVSSRDQVVVPLARMKLLGQCLGALAFVAVGLWMIKEPPRHGLWAQFMGAVTVAFFGAVGVVGLSRLLRPGPAIRIDNEGILDDASGVSLGLIRWDQVGVIEEYRVEGQAFLSIQLRDLDDLIEKQPFWKRRIIRANLRMGAGAVNIPQASLGIELEELRRAIERYRREAAARRFEAERR